MPTGSDPIVYYLFSFSFLQPIPIWCISLSKDVLKFRIKSSRLEVSVKKIFLKILQNSQENTCARVSFFIKLQALGSGTGISCEFLEISKNTFCYRTPSVRSLLGGMNFLHVNNFCQAVPHRQDCSFSLDSVCFCIYYVKKCNSSYKI